MISLIANTGIQFYTKEICLDMSDSGIKMYFYESFDTQHSKLKLEIAHWFTEDNIWVRKKDLAQFGYLREGMVQSGWDEISKEINAIPESLGTCFNRSINSLRIEQFENTWLPFPYFGSNSKGESTFGPTNWCRIKIMPIQGSSQANKRYNVILAFDTRTLYEDAEDDDKETPLFTSEYDSNNKIYKLCNNEFLLLDFLSKEKNCDWVNEFVFNLIHKNSDINTLHSPKLKYLASFVFLINYLQKKIDLPEIQLLKDRNVQSCNVDISIDIGNSKTSVILFDEGDFTKVRPLELVDFSNPCLKHSEPFDMRLVFHKADFGRMGKVDSKQFSHPSLVRLGNEANRIIHKIKYNSSGKEKISTLSSPKRYLWDKQESKVEWEFAQTVENGENESIWINGISQQFGKDGSLDITGNGGRSNTYSRKSLMTFAFLEILTQARSQINSHTYRLENGKTNLPRKINKVIITCPTAMSKLEQIALRKSAEEAAIALERQINGTFNEMIDYKEYSSKVKIFPSLNSLTNTEENKEWSYDEATCAQIVFLYAEISKRYLNNSKEFFELYGKKSVSENKKNTLTVGSLDIGAGTTDLVICKYTENSSGQTTIKPVPQFWESFYYAGDDLLKEIVRQTIIEGTNGTIKNKLIEIGKGDSASALLFDFFGINHSSMTHSDRLLRNDFNLQISIPIALAFLELNRTGSKDLNMSYSQIFKSENAPSDLLLNHFKEHFGFSFEDLVWKYSKEHIEQIITKTFESLLQKIAGIFYAYNCDFILLSGRPTTLPQIEKLFLKFFPVPPNRLITLNNYRVGTWYPFQDGNGYFANQKSIVAIGAMIGHIASTQGGLSGFSIDFSELIEKIKPTTNYFGQINENTRRFEKHFISPEINNAKVEIISIPTKIGTRQLSTVSYPTRVFYVIDFNEKNIEDKMTRKGLNGIDEVSNAVDIEKTRIRNLCPLSINLIREDFHFDKESISLESVFDKNGDELPLKYFNLQIQSMYEADDFWLDTGEFLLDIQTQV